jgi:amino acid adenylation domain-containing protein
MLAYYARTAPGHAAVLAPDVTPVTYGELWTRTSDTIQQLRRLGVGNGDRIAVVLPRGAETAMAIVGVATAAVCVPLNPDLTADELQRYFSDLRVTALLTRADMNSASRSVAHSLGIPVIDLSPRRDEGLGAFDLVGSMPANAETGDLASATSDAFVLLTSGTTSRPKMVPLTHASVCLSAYNAGAVLALRPEDRLLNVLPLFHAHGLISGVLTALAAGSSVICTSGFDPASFFGWLRELQPTWYTAVPTIHRALLSTADHHSGDAERSSLRIIRSASASLPPDILNGLESLFGVPVIETYGMTEGTSQIAANRRELRKIGSVGRAAGPEIAILDDEGRRLPAGKPGEIVLRGPTIARGYDNDIAATEAAFRDGWFRTGDLGYLDRDGYLFIVGRIKEVINRGGQKVSPFEVEEALLSHPDVLEAGAFAIPHPSLGENVAAVVSLRPNSATSPRELRDFAAKRLARYKVPGLIRVVPEIPKGASGKVRRSALAGLLSTLPGASDSGETTTLPRSELEVQLASIWAELLELGQIGIDQDVFALGADSLTVTQFFSRLRERFDVRLSFEDMFDAPTVAALAARLDASRKKHAAVSQARADTPADARSIPLSFQQQRIYVLSRLDPTRYNYNVVEVARLLGPLDAEALEASIATICKRHEILRSTFSEGAGETVQTVGAFVPRLERLDFEPCAKSRRAAAIGRQARKFAQQPFELEREPPLQAQLLRLAKDDHALVTKIHHLATDGWSQRLFWKELETHYAARHSGTVVRLAEPGVQYRNFVDWQRAWPQTQAAKEQLNYWRVQLEGVTELPLRTDRPRPEIWSGRGAKHCFKFSRSLSQNLEALSRSQSVTLYMTLLAAFQCLLCRYTNHDDVAVGSLIANRNQIPFEPLIGMFANTLVMRTDLSGDPTFNEVLRRVRRVTLDAYRNQDLPIEEILRALRLSRSGDRKPLFQIMFILQNASAGTPALPGLTTHFMDFDPEIARFDLTLELAMVGEHLTGFFEYSTDLLDASTMARMAAHFRVLLEAIVANPDEQISRLPLLPVSERRRVLTEWNGASTDFGRRGNFSQWFARQLKSAPGATAVSIGDARFDYQELARRSSAIADRLTREGVGPETVVALFAERDVNLLSAIIAVQRVGGAFLCLEPTLPAARLAKTVQSSGAPLLLVGEGSATALEEVRSHMPPRARPLVLMLEDLVGSRPSRPKRPARPAPSSLAYLIYTSGSTGVPKGVLIEQRGLLNHLVSLISELKLSAADVVAQTAPQSFVISVWQFLAGLMVGARVHICSDEIVKDPALLAQEISREGVTVLQIVPSLLRKILERVTNEPAFRTFGRLRLLISTGEPLPADLCHAWFRHFPNVPMVNAYGSSECSDDVALHRLTAAPAQSASVPIGRPIPNTSLYVLDACSQPVPIGLVGELCVGGAGVGRGYLNDPEQTQQKFSRDPFPGRRDARLYRTGDLARWRGDGTLDCLGRIDQQVKIRGYRIELKEIEHVLLEHPDVEAATVLPRDEIGSETRLVAHVVAAAGRQAKPDDLREFLKARLPGYMIPASFMFLERMPVNAHGKVDRSALRTIDQGETTARDAEVAPRHATEKALAEIWIDLLEVENIGVTHNFFDLGGHSLLAGQVLARVANAFGVSLPIKAVFEAPTVEELARRIDAASAMKPHAPPVELLRTEETGARTVSIAQDQMIRVERELPGLPQFNLPFALRLQGPLNVGALEQSLVEVVRRHESLRSGFGWLNKQSVARVVPAEDIGSVLDVEDTGRKSTEGPAAKALQLKRARLLAEQEAWTPFDIARAPLIRARLLRLGKNDHVLLMTMHHAIVDGWSIGILFEEISKLYSAFVGGREAPLPQPTMDFSQAARWQRWWCTTESAARQLAYWRKNLREASPVFRAGPDSARARPGSPSAHEPVRLSRDLMARLRAFGGSQNGTLFMSLLTGLKALLLARTGCNDICVATAMGNRAQPDTDRVIGPFENTSIIRTRMDPDISFREAFGRVRDAILEAHARQELPFNILAARLAEEDGLDPASLIQVYFTLQNPLRQPLKLPDIAVRPLADAYREGQPVLPINQSWLMFMLKERPSGITGTCTYKSELFETRAIRHWIEDFTAILARAATRPDVPLGRLLDHLAVGVEQIGAG